MNLDEALDRLQRAGCRITEQRRIVVQTALSYGRYFTATEIEREVLDTNPGLGRATIFRTLESLAGAGLLARVGSGLTRGYIVCAAEDHHHHLVCSSCHLVVKVPGCLVEERMAQVSAATAFRVDGHHLEYYGLCAKCQGKS